MSQNNGLILVRHTEGYRKYHAAPESAMNSVMSTSVPRRYPRTYTRPICGIRGRDAAGFTTIEIVTEGDGSTIPFAADQDEVCDRCIRVAEKMQSGMSLDEATRIHAPKLSKKALDTITADDTALAIVVREDTETIDHIKGRRSRRITAHVTAAPLRTFTVYNHEYREDVTYPARLTDVSIYVIDGEVSVSGQYRLLHPKSLQETVGKKLDRRVYTDETDTDTAEVANTIRASLN